MLNSLIISFRDFHDCPPSTIASLALADSSTTLFPASTPSSPSMRALTTSEISSLVTKPLIVLSLVWTLTAIFSSSTKNLELNGWSACIGQTANGTPAVTLSSTEFHPQWLKNPCTLIWFRISNWSTHSLTTKPLSFVRSSKPNPRSIFSGLTAHIKSTSARSSPFATSFNCDSGIAASVPRAIYRTVLPAAALSSSHSIQEGRWALGRVAVGWARQRGPMGQDRGPTCWFQNSR